jgi:4-hydroxy-tetrahydrodipicolinate reductase
MRVSIIGYGAMGQMVERAARAGGHAIAAIVDPVAAAAPGRYKTIAEVEDLGDAAVEFTRPDTAAANITALAGRGIPTVAGTTGWHDRLGEVTRAVEAAGGALLWSSNFSMGVNLFYRIAWYAAELFNSFPEYDAGGCEVHHNHKLDSPSGTAKTLVKGVLARLDRKRGAVWETLNRRPEPDELHFPSLRLGSAPGTHRLLFDSPADTIEITHTARSREGFAAGAVRAAEWLTACPRRGVFTVDDMLRELLGI